LLFLAMTSALLSSSNSTAPMGSETTARCKGVSPLLSLAFTAA
jgi:hypothetical protein